jgi:NADP-dependent 3-hydroxy acid dehydrogenase YdfG
LFGAIREKFGGVDVLVNNAGLGHDAPLTSGATDEWREMLELNVLALCICTREAIADMRRRGDDGHVVHVSSLAAHRVPPGSGVYAATKFAVRALTEALRQELRALGSKPSVQVTWRRSLRRTITRAKKRPAARTDAFECSLRKTSPMP